MTTNTAFCTVIPPVSAHISRPLWSIMIPTYNCANYLRETLTSVLAQDLGPDVMQIEVIDDCSTKDDPQAIVEEVGKGRIGFYRQPQNVGHTHNFATCLQRSRGHLVHLLHGDDCVKAGFYQKMQQAFETSPDIGAAFCRHTFMDEYSYVQLTSPLEQSESGILSNWLEKIAIEQRIQTPSIVVRREVYEKLGGFDQRLLWCEDWEMWVRIATHYPIWYEVETLANYRYHASSSTARNIKTGENLKDLRRAITIMQSYLPKPLAKEIFQKANYSAMSISLVYASNLLYKRDWIAAINQIKEGFKFGYFFEFFKLLIPILLHTGLREFKASLPAQILKFLINSKEFFKKVTSSFV